MAKSSANSCIEMESHRVHLMALLRQEQDIAYRRSDYLSHEWQMGLWKEEIKESMQMAELRQSPSSFTSTNAVNSSSRSIPEVQ